MPNFGTFWTELKWNTGMSICSTLHTEQTWGGTHVVIAIIRNGHGDQVQTLVESEFYIALIILPLGKVWTE